MTAFRFTPRPVTWATVKVNAPGEDGIEVQSFRAKFLILPEEERQALASSGSTGRGSPISTASPCPSPRRRASS
jgi:hypothetical protein